MQQKRQRQAEQEKRMSEAHQDIAGALGIESVDHPETPNMSETNGSDGSITHLSTTHVSEPNMGQTRTTNKSNTSVDNKSTTNEQDKINAQINEIQENETNNEQINGTHVSDTNNVHIESTHEDSAAEILQSFKNSIKRETVEDTHTRKTFIVRNDLLRELDKLSKKQGRGFQTWFVNMAFERLLDELKSERKR